MESNLLLEQYSRYKKISLEESPYKCLLNTDIDLNPHQINAFIAAVQALKTGGIVLADEVGLGKTLIACGVIAKMAKLRYLENDPLFKVVYVCSNQNVARQNIRKLDIFKTGYDDIAETRLSMQHLKAEEQEILHKEVHQETGETWVVLDAGLLPF